MSTSGRAGHLAEQLYREAVVLVGLLDAMQPREGSPEHGLLISMRATCEEYQKSKLEAAGRRRAERIRAQREDRGE